jgi:ribonucleoside-diphosphate reductase alpha chain
VTSHDIRPEWHVRTQAAFQKYTDNAVSKTVNFANDASIEDVRTVYTLAYELGCKGVTIYRDGSKSVQVLSTGQTGKAREVEQAEGTIKPVGAGDGGVLQEAEEIASGPVPRRPRERPSRVSGVTHRVRTSNGNLYVTINVDERGRPFEVFTALGKAGSADSAQLEAVSRLTSLALRAGVDIEAIVGQLRGITDTPVWDNGILVRSAPDAVALALSAHIENGSETGAWSERTMEGGQLGLFPQGAQPTNEALTGEADIDLAQGVRCPDCSGKLAYQEGCLMCHACGFNKCG